MREMLPIVLSMGLFIITLIIIFTLRKADRRDRKLELMKRYVNQHQAEIERIGEQMKETALDAQTRLAKQQEELNGLLLQVQQRQNELLAYDEDLEELQKTIAYYHQVLGQLSAMTEKAEMRIKLIREEMTKVESMHQTIDTYVGRIDEVEETIKQQNEQLRSVLDQYRLRIAQQMEEAIAEAKVRVDNYADSALARIDLPFQQHIATVQQYLQQLDLKTQLLEDVVQRLSNASLATLQDLQTYIASVQAQLQQSGGQTEVKQDTSVVLHDEEEDEVHDELEEALAQKERLLEEEERKELALRAMFDDPDHIMNSIESGEDEQEITIEDDD